MKIKNQLIKYADAGYPIIYINSFEEFKTDGIIKEVMGGREGLEWNGAKGFVEFGTKSTLIEGKKLVETLRLLDTDNELDRKFLVLKDVSGYLEENEVIAVIFHAKYKNGKKRIKAVKCGQWAENGDI